MTAITEFLWKGFMFIIENPSKAILFGVIIFATFMVRPIYLLVSSIWNSLKLIVTDPKGMLLWIGLLLLGLLILKGYGVI
ncbi:MAG: hypothetical protein RBQ91_00385 [Acholeplasma sp.]|nr:hypothetical protein [Acholeplasma sp.]